MLAGAEEADALGLFGNTPGQAPTPKRLSAAGGAGSSFNCDKPGQLWAKMNAAGVQSGVPDQTENLLLTGTPDASAGTKAATSLASVNSKNAFDANAAADGKLKKPCIPPGGQNDINAVLDAYAVNPPPCPP